MDSTLDRNASICIPIVRDWADDAVMVVSDVLLRCSYAGIFGRRRRRGSMKHDMRSASEHP